MSIGHCDSEVLGLEQIRYMYRSKWNFSHHYNNNVNFIHIARLQSACTHLKLLLSNVYIIVNTISFLPLWIMGLKQHS